ncbi:hypothetical protein [Planococcus sp. SSTMD024]|uniref:hypothetical protein n=1 Tax=Planococcus sp. SSTMD024 TaxID=3242163 RepID=UPI00351EE61B
MEFLAAVGILLVSLLLAYQLGKDYSRKGKYIIWGITTMFVICPLFSWLVSMGYAYYEQSGWAAVAMLAILYPSTFIIGLVLLLMGIFRKKDAVRRI